MEMSGGLGLFANQHLYYEILIFALTGEIVLTASEVLNNDGSPGIVIRANMDLQLGVSKHYTEVGFKNPLKFKSIECNLLLETVRGEGNSTGGENTREDRGSQTEEEELS